jgi:hypothetical protein
VGASAPVEGHRLPRRLCAQLLVQRPPAGLVLGQGGAALSAAGQEQHQLPVGLLPPRLQRQQAPRGAESGLRLPAPHVLIEGPLQGPRQGPRQGRPLRPQPFLEGRGVAQGEAGEQLVLVEAGRRFEARAAPVREVGPERGHVDPVGEVGLEGDSLPVNRDVRPHGPPQVGQDVAEELVGAGLGDVPGQEGGQGLPAVRASAEGQVRQEGQGGPPAQGQGPAVHGGQGEPEQTEAQLSLPGARAPHAPVPRPNCHHAGSCYLKCQP